MRPFANYTYGAGADRPSRKSFENHTAGPLLSSDDQASFQGNKPAHLDLWTRCL